MTYERTINRPITAFTWIFNILVLLPANALALLLVFGVALRPVIVIPALIIPWLAAVAARWFLHSRLRCPTCGQRLLRVLHPSSLVSKPKAEFCPFCGQDFKALLSQEETDNPTEHSNTTSKSARSAASEAVQC